MSDAVLTRCMCQVYNHGSSVGWEQSQDRWDGPLSGRGGESPVGVLAVLASSLRAVRANLGND